MGNQYARKNVNPKLTDEANMVLKEFYVSTRNSSGDEESPVPITARPRITNPTRTTLRSIRMNTPP